MEATEVKNRVAFIVSMTVIAIAAVFLFIIGYLAFVPVKVVTANTQPYKVLTPSIEAGENVIYIADVCKFKEVSSQVTRIFIDENNVHYPIGPQLSVIGVGCGNNKVPVPTLPTLHSGKWYLSLDVEYQVNPIRRQTYHFRTETFTITNKIIKPGVQ